MIRYVVDTNVPVVANGRIDSASIDCRLAAIEFLRELCVSGITILDMAGEIMEEYFGRLHPSGQPGVGDNFLRMILNNTPKRVERITLRKSRTTGEFEDFPSDSALAGFDRSDRKFAAAARKSGAPVANAVDSDWLDHKQALRANGISVDFICGCDAARRKAVE